MKRQHLLGSIIALGVLVVFLLIMVAITRHPASIQGDRIWLFWLDSGLLVAYAATPFWLWRQSSPGVILSTSVGMKLGVLLGCVHITNHLTEEFALWLAEFSDPDGNQLALMSQSAPEAACSNTRPTPGLIQQVAFQVTG